MLTVLPRSFAQLYLGLGEGAMKSLLKHCLGTTDNFSGRPSSNLLTVYFDYVGSSVNIHFYRILHCNSAPESSTSLGDF
jgi:hypothetical protein